MDEIIKKKVVESFNSIKQNQFNSLQFTRKSHGKYFKEIAFAVWGMTIEAGYIYQMNGYGGKKYVLEITDKR